MLPSGRPALAPTRTALDNGLVVLAKETRKTPAVSVNLAIRAGSVVDPPGAPGAMHLLSRVIDRGTLTLSARQIADALDGCGVTLNVVASRHLFSFVWTCLAEDFDAVLALVAGIVMAPSVPEAELETRKGEVVTQIRQNDDSPAVRAALGLTALLYGPDHPYGRSPLGTVASVEGVTRDQLMSLHGTRFAPGDTTLVAVGDVQPGRVAESAARVFGAWRTEAHAQPVLSSPAPAVGRRRVVVPMMNKSQADISYGFTSVTRSDPSYYALHLANNALGQYALGGRLGDSIRERQGMAYYVGSALDAGVIAGPLTIRAGVSAANVDRAVASIDEELTRLRKDGLTQAELDESRQYLTRSMPRSFETNEGIAGFLQTSEFFGLGLDHDARLPGLLAAVTLDEVAAVVERVIDPARASLVIAGPYADQ